MRAINFNAGPAGLPLPALERARDELHRLPGLRHVDHGAQPPRQGVRGGPQRGDRAAHPSSSAFPTTHQVLFLQGGASPAVRDGADELPARRARAPTTSITGGWSEKALDEAKLLGTPRVAATTVGPDKRYTRMPSQAELKLDPKAAYVHITSNNTIFGTQWHAFPTLGTVPLVADMSLGLPVAADRRLAASRSSTPARRRTSGPSGRGGGHRAQGLHGEGAQGHPEDLPLHDPRREQLALQHAPHVRDLPDAQRARAGSRSWAGWRAMEQRNREKARAALRRDRPA